MHHPRLLLFPLGEGGDERDRLAGAVRVAAALGVHLRVMHTVLEPRALLPRDVALPASLLSGLDQAMDQHAERDHARLVALFEEICDAAGVPRVEDPVAQDGPSASWFEARGVRSALIERFGKLADWVLQFRPPGGRATASLRAALVDAGRPVLLLPRRLDRFALDTVVVAWNGSVECTRALGAALPLLPRAGRVVIASTPAASTPAVAARGPDAGEVASYLAVHGVASERLDVESHGPEAPALLEAAVGESASLVVLGAAGTHRVREFLLGTVTAHMLEHCPLPMLMAR